MISCYKTHCRCPTSPVAGGERPEVEQHRYGYDGERPVPDCMEATFTLALNLNLTLNLYPTLALNLNLNVLPGPDPNRA